MTPSPKSGMYFEGDIEKSAVALIEMFGDEAPLRASERAADYEKGSQGARFWKLVTDATTAELLKRAEK